MQTFIEIMKWAGGMMMIFGVIYALGMTMADKLYRNSLGETYYELNVISLWDVFSIFIIGCALTILVIVLEAVFNAGVNAGERSASGGNDDE